MESFHKKEFFYTNKCFKILQLYNPIILNQSTQICIFSWGKMLNLCKDVIKMNSVTKLRAIVKLNTKLF